METNELHEGFMSNQELANWFDITENGFSKRKSKILPRLSDYCN